MSPRHAFLSRIANSFSEHTLTEAEIEDNILFLKSATRDQILQIISKHRATFQYRRKFCLNIYLFDTFPRFLDTPELVSKLLK